MLHINVFSLTLVEKGKRGQNNLITLFRLREGNKVRVMVSIISTKVKG